MNEGFIKRHFRIGNILFLALLVHITYFNSGFIGLDHGDIESGRALLPISKLLYAFTEPFGQTSFYRPVVIIANSIDRAIWGTNPFGYHATNILLFLLFVYVAYKFFIEFFKLKVEWALLATLTVAVHPISWLVSGFIAYRPELLTSLFSLTALIFHLRYKKQVNIKNLILAAFFVFAALLSKETPLFWLPALILYIEADQYRKKGVISTKLLATEGVVISLYLLLRINTVPDIWRSASYSLSLSESIGTRAFAIIRQTSYLISPLRPLLSDAVPITSFVSSASLLFVVLALILIAMVFKRGVWSKEGKIIIFAVISLIPALNIVPLPRFISPHYSFMATVALGAAFALLGKYKRIFLYFVLTWIVLAGITTFTSGALLKNDRTVMEQEILRSENFLEGYFYLGFFYEQEGKFETSREYYKKAISLKNQKFIAYVDEPALLINLARTEIELGNTKEAKTLLTTAKDKYPMVSRQARYNLALIHAMEEDYQVTIALLSPDIDTWDIPEPAFLLAQAYLALNNSEEAADTLETVLPLLNEENREKTRYHIEKLRLRE